MQNLPFGVQQWVLGTCIKSGKRNLERALFNLAELLDVQLFSSVVVEHWILGPVAVIPYQGSLFTLEMWSWGWLRYGVPATKVFWCFCGPFFLTRNREALCFGRRSSRVLVVRA